MEQVENIQEIGVRSEERAKAWYSFLENETDWQPLVQNSATRSDTVIAVKGDPQAITAIKKAAIAEGITLGNGYGEWKNTTFRIANFPAIEEEEIEKLKAFLSKI
jgi:phosphoserine aminotransferase